MLAHLLVLTEGYTVFGSLRVFQGTSFIPMSHFATAHLRTGSLSELMVLHFGTFISTMTLIRTLPK